MGKLEGKVAIVTGGSRGIGKAIARGLAAEGANVVIAARGVEKLAQAAQEIAGPGATVVPIPTDVTNEAEVTALFQRTLDLFHRLDILVNNAGVFDGGPLDELPVETWDKVMAANLRGPFLCTRAALRIMKPQGVGESSTLGASRHSGPA
jgi:NAD(P)-dependent dehydrogenase (short-subunit alcohol dehydrogenase family)